MLRVAVLTLAVVAFATATLVQPNLLKSFETNERVHILVNFVGGNRAVVNSIETQSFASRTARHTALRANLERHAETSQQSVQRFLQDKSVSFRSFWISNQISVKGATKDIALALGEFAEVEEVRQAPVIPHPAPFRGNAVQRQEDVEWGIARIKANQVWNITNGTGAVVANIDTGVRGTHVALRNSWRQNRGWFEPSRFTELPNDPDNHGTHTMGTICGADGIGVAPGAQWIACSVRNDFDTEDLLDCGQFMICPTHPNGSDPDCSMSPDLVSNSWSGGGYDPWFEGVTDAWIAADIIPISSSGNTGSSCGSADRSPGGYRKVISCGSTNIGHRLSSYSSVGPGQNGRIKPIVSAPGEDVRSCIASSDTAYNELSGTSMSTPHVAGVVALLRSVRPNLTYAQVRQALIDGVTNDELIARNSTCGGINDTEGFPNMHFGYGQVDALKIVQNAMKMFN